MCVKNQKNVSSGIYILKSNCKYPTPNQVKNIIPMDLVRNPIPLNPKPITLPRATVTYIPTHICMRLRKIGANTPNKKYSIIKKPFIKKRLNKKDTPQKIRPKKTNTS